MKRTNKLLLCLTLSFILFSCKDDNKSNTILRLDAEELKQTSWYGKLKESSENGDNASYWDVGMIFYTTKNGKYDIKRVENDSQIINNFEYSVDEKMLIIKRDIYLSGNWLLIEKSKDKMVFEQSTGGEYSYTSTLVLNKKH